MLSTTLLSFVSSRLVSIRFDDEDNDGNTSCVLVLLRFAIVCLLAVFDLDLRAARTQKFDSPIYRSLVIKPSFLFYGSRLVKQTRLVVASPEDFIRRRNSHFDT